MKWLKWTGLTLAALVVALALLTVWLMHAPAGARWVAGVATNVLGAKLDIGAVEGDLAGPLVLTNIHYRDPAAGLDVHVDRAKIDLSLQRLWAGVLRVEDADVRGVDVLLTEPQAPAQPPPEESQEPFTLEPPIDFIVDQFNVADVRIRRADETLFELTSGAFAGHWTEQDLNVERLELQSPQGEVSFAGRVAEQDAFVGEGRGQFRWQVGEQTFAGRLHTQADDETAQLDVDLTAPVRADLDVALQQSENLPWRIQLEAPRFDPREQLAPDSSFESLAASLQGSGTLKAGSISGEIVINGEPLRVDQVRFERDPEQLAFNAQLGVGERKEQFEARGRVKLGEETWTADVDAQWGELEIPAAWAGQTLHTRGELALAGNTETFDAKGEIRIGPPDRIARIALAASGTPQSIELSQLDIVQPDGRLAANGRIDLKPTLGWTLSAEGDSFNPGAFVVEWPGELNFNLATQGRITADGPSATLQLENLKGRLRGRALTGSGNLAITPDLVPSGTLALRSGQSSLRFNGEPGEAIDAVASFNIASLDDWLPDAEGALTGDFRVRGQWPEVSINGEARGSELNVADVQLAALELNAQVENPKEPQGDVRVDLQGLRAAGFEFSSMQARAAGGSQDHQLTLQATGEPLGVNLTVQGQTTQAGWTGSLRNLVLDLADAAQLSLREPVRIEIADGAFDVSRACLVDQQIELCARGETTSAGALEATYSLANVPLSLAEAFTGADFPLQLEGVLEGRGAIRRTPEGELFGDAVLRSSSGEISRRLTDAPGENEPEDAQLLLAYRDLDVTATLEGSRANARVNAAFADDGVIEGQASVRGLDQQVTPIDAQLTANVPDLAPFGVLAPQLINLQGRAEARLRIAGTLQEPQIAGRILAQDLAAHIPALGLHLENGRLEAEPTDAGDIRIAGGIESGDGRLQFDGVANPSGAIELNIDGKQFLAVDIPGARALVTPDLQFARSEERMRLTGQVTIPQATVNLQKLPKGERAQAASSDVVVIDAKTRDEEVEEAPLFANVTVILGEEVELTGFGLQAQVEGRLDVSEQPGEPTVGSGEVRVAGRYKAYGQDLTIQEGRLLYASTPLDNPRLNIEATRQVDDVTAGLRVRGTAQNPELTVFSDPPMAQANALAYLVAGKPLDEVGADDGEGDAMQTAARSLGAATGGLLAKAVGRRLGVDKLAVEDEEALGGGAALTIGQYLSPRLFLSYGVGLFEPGDVVTLRYRLTEDVHVKAQTSPIDTRAGIEYRVER